MSRKQPIANLRSYFGEFSIFFIAKSVFESPNAEQIANTLATVLPKDHSFITFEGRQAALRSEKGKKAFLILKNANVLHGEITDTFVNTTKKIIDSGIRTGKLRKVLLITLDDKEGFAYEQLDYEDNHINDIDAVGFDDNLKCFQYIYEAPIEEIVFKFKVDGVQINNLKIIFKKTIGVDKKTLYEESDNKTNCIAFGPNFAYKTTKNLLFESDKFYLVGSCNGQRVESPLYDFYFEKTQNWIVKVINGQIVCEFYTGNQQKPQDTVTEQKNYQQDIEEADSGYESILGIHLYSQDPIQSSNEVRSDKFFGQKSTKSSASGNKYSPTLKEGDTVFYENGQSITLTKFVAAGGQGTIYLVNKKGIVAKIMKEVEPQFAKRVETMASMKLGEKNPRLIWPLDSLYANVNGTKKFVGYTMQAIDNGVSLQKCISQNETKLNDPKSFGIFNYSREELLLLIISWLDTMAYLHKRNIVIRDIKPLNLMLRKNKKAEMLVVDCDGFQFDDNIATAFTQGFTAPEFVHDVYQTKAGDDYAVFIVLMMLLVTKGACPYSQLNVEGQANYNTGFPYFLNANETAAKVTKGYPAINWSHLPKYVKEAFISVGSKNGTRTKATNRITSEEWMRIFIAYYKDLKSGRLNADKDAHVACHSVRNQPIDYRLVDIAMSTTVKGKKAEFSLLRAVESIFRGNSITGVNKNDVVNGLKTNGAYKKKGSIAIKVNRDIGILCEVEYAYVE